MEHAVDRSPLGALLRSERQRRRFSLTRLAQAAGLSKNTLVNLERGVDRRSGRESMPTPKTLRAIARALAAEAPHEETALLARLLEAAGYGSLVPAGAVPVLPALPPVPALSLTTFSRLPPEEQRAVAMEMFRRLSPAEQEAMAAYVRTWLDLHPDEVAPGEWIADVTLTSQSRPVE